MSTAPAIPLDDQITPATPVDGETPGLLPGGRMFIAGGSNILTLTYFLTAIIRGK